MVISGKQKDYEAINQKEIKKKKKKQRTENMNNAYAWAENVY